MQAKADELAETIMDWSDAVVHDFVRFLALPPTTSTDILKKWDMFRHITLPHADVPLKQPDTIVTRCAYVFKKGKRIDSTCGVEVRNEGLFCAKHSVIPKVSTKVFEMDLGKLEEEDEEEMYLSPCDDEDKKSENAIDDDAIEDESIAIDDDEEDVIENDDGDDGDDEDE